MTACLSLSLDSPPHHCRRRKAVLVVPAYCHGGPQTKQYFCEFFLLHVLKDALAGYNEQELSPLIFLFCLLLVCGGSVGGEKREEGPRCVFSDLNLLLRLIDVRST